MSSITAAFLFVVKNIERLCLITAKAEGAAERENGSAQEMYVFRWRRGTEVQIQNNLKRSPLIYKDFYSSSHS